MTLPVLLSIPHAGKEVPNELSHKFLLNHEQIIKDGDEFAAEIYDLDEHVEAVVRTGFARAVVDMNRAPDDRRLDGVLKQESCWGEKVWSSELSSEETELLLGEHRRYHLELSKMSRRRRVLLGLDCHTMLGRAPPISKSPGKLRPHACLSNAHGTCPPQWMDIFASCLERHLKYPVALNAPFQGGYIIRQHCLELPWIQLEFSRDNYLEPWEKKQAFLEALKDFCEIVFIGRC